jgi:hypothetical protein
MTLTLVLGAFCADLATAGQVENGGGQRIVGNGAASTAYYAPSGVISLDGLSFFLYVQGDDNIFSPPGDQVFLLKHPNTWSGLTTAFDLSTKIQILPGASQDPTYYYGGPEAFTDAGNYYMLVPKSRLAADFNTMLFGCSTDGVSWTWRTLFTTPVGENISGATVRYSVINNQSYWWGYVDLSPCQVPGEVCTTPFSGLGAFRIHLTSHSPSSCASPTWDRVEFWAGGSWQTVTPGQQLTFVPDYLSFNDIQPKLHLVNGHWELWTTAVSEPNYHCGCDSGSSSNYSAGFHYQTVATGATTLSPSPTEVYSQIRCLPASYPQSRWTPFRVETTNLLYSASRDLLPCGSTQAGDYIVVTALTP